MIGGPRFWGVIVLLVGATVALHTLSHGERTPLVNSLNAALPIQFEGWSGSDVPIEARIIEAVKVDDYLSREYRDAGGWPILLYVGFYKSQRTGESIHSPKNCLPGAGWAPVQAGTVELHPVGGPPVTVNLYVIQKGLQKLIVVYWYQSHGRIIASEYWGKIYMVADAIRLNRTDSALVRVSTPIGNDEAMARQKLIAFAEQVLPRLDAAIPR